MVAKAARKATGRPFKKGDARINRVKPGPGRPPDAFKELCRQLAAGETTVKNVENILGDPAHPQFMAALRWATEHGYGKPQESLEVKGEVTHKHQIWKFGDKEVAF